MPRHGHLLFTESKTDGTGFGEPALDPPVIYRASVSSHRDQNNTRTALEFPNEVRQRFPRDFIDEHNFLSTKTI
jgi:hypothetical protein